MPWTADIPAEDLRCYSPFRPPDWRWQSAQEHIHRDTFPGGWEDPGIIRAHQLLIGLDRAETEVDEVELTLRCPVLSIAHAIYAGGDVKKDELEARLLCQSPELIAAGMGISTEIIWTYATVFFDVVDSINALDWMLMQGVGVPHFSSPPKEAECWRFIAWVGGPFILDLLVADYLGRPTPEYADRHGLAERARFLVRDAASLMQTGRPADPEIVEEHSRLYRDDVRSGRRKPDPQTALQLKILRLAAKLPRCREIEKSLPKVSSPRRRSGKGQIEQSPVQTMLKIPSALPRIDIKEACEQTLYPSLPLPVCDRSALPGIRVF